MQRRTQICRLSRFYRSPMEELRMACVEGIFGFRMCSMSSETNLNLGNEGLLIMGAVSLTCLRY